MTATTIVCCGITGAVTSAALNRRAFGGFLPNGWGKFEVGFVEGMTWGGVAAVASHFFGAPGVGLLIEGVYVLGNIGQVCAERQRLIAEMVNQQLWQFFLFNVA